MKQQEALLIRFRQLLKNYPQALQQLPPAFLAETEGLLQYCDEEKASLYAHLTHGVRTPVNGISGFAEILLKTETDPVRRGQLQQILDSSQLLLSNLNKITGYMEDGPPNFPEGKVYDEESIHVLVAEDNTINLLLMKTMLRRLLPFAVIDEAHTGDECFLKCTDHLPDIIFMDLRMPGTSGYDACRMIRASYPEAHLPIIAVTASALPGEKEKCLQTGMNDYMTKPISEAALAAMIQTWVVEQKEHINLAVINEITGNSPERRSAFLRIARKEIDGSIEKINDALKIQDSSLLKEAVHKLCGTASAAGLIQLSKIAGKIEQIPSWDQALAFQLVQQLQQETSVVYPILDQVIAL